MEGFDVRHAAEHLAHRDWFATQKLLMLDDNRTAWFKLKLPEISQVNYGILFKKVYAQDIRVYMDNQIVYESYRDYGNDQNKFVLKFSPDDSYKDIYILLYSQTTRMGIETLVEGEYQELIKSYMQNDMLDVILGAALIFISVSLLICLLIVRKTYLRGWSSLCFVVMSFGVMVVAYSPYSYMFFEDFEFFTYYMFDVASTVVLPFIFTFFEHLFGKGPRSIISRYKKIQITISVISIVWLILGITLGGAVEQAYKLVISLAFGLSLLVGILILLFILIYYCSKNNQESIIVACGFGMFGVIAICEILWYYYNHQNYDLFYWKWGFLAFIVSLITILLRRTIMNYEQMIKYSRELDVFNNELQRAEKMEIISQLAASVAHEVRNPLQVTRGFLQLLGNKTEDSSAEKGYIHLAITELDRASEIITDFLTFAKPQVEHPQLLDLTKELMQLKVILIPMVTQHGGELKIKTEDNLFIRGSSSKFKQALINLIKNGVEACSDQMVIQVWAYSHDEYAVIHIKDNGEGMDEETIARLGEPYYSKKSKGTGLGLMVTYRIVEAMQGFIHFESSKGQGTEVILRLPLTQK
ncbi:ATP-binding protein [Paenibacillus sp. NPDC058071]|uniref:ATP-binding protein n=1 Tax=Paenibacillus sp. NPDC058071 TaxID=3346326 RepID=UPI0036D8775A